MIAILIWVFFLFRHLWFHTQRTSFPVWCIYTATPWTNPSAATLTPLSQVRPIDERRESHWQPQKSITLLDITVFDTTNPNYTTWYLAEEDRNETTSCRYPGYRNPPSDPDAYDPSLMYWHIFAARLVFVVIFEVCIACSLIGKI